jgi:hypothetical protein
MIEWRSVTPRSMTPLLAACPLCHLPSDMVETPERFESRVTGGTFVKTSCACGTLCAWRLGTSPERSTPTGASS